MYVCDLIDSDEKKTKMPRTFILNDESVINSFGFMVLNSGIDFTRFNSNPVMLDNHDPDKIIGRWENVRVEGTQLKADAIFDEEDDDAKKVMGKVDRGFLKGASMGIHPIAGELKAVPGGDAVPVLTKSELFEGSTTSVPSNSLALYSAKGELLSAENIKLSIDKFTKPNQNMDKITLSAKIAGILKTATEVTTEVLSAAIETLSTSKEKAENDLNNFLKERATTLVDGAISEGRLTAEKKDSFITLAISDFKQASEIIQSMPTKTTLSDKVRNPNGGDNRDGWDYMKWAKEDPKGLQKLSVEQPEAFKALKEAFKPKN